MKSLLALLPLVLFSLQLGCDAPSSVIEEKPQTEQPSTTTATHEIDEGKRDGPTNVPSATGPAEDENGANAGSETKVTTADESANDSNASNNSAVGDAPNIQIRMFCWNVESDGADSEVIAKQLAEFNQNDHYDVLALTEVKPQDLKKFRYALGKHYKYSHTRSGNSDRLEILYNQNRFQRIREFEIKEINIKGRYRAPLVAHLKDRQTGIEFLVMNNHLARGKSEIRQKQAEMLVDWARDQTLPVFALGDYNFDYVFETRKGNPAFANMLRDNIWRWVEPTKMIDSNWYDDPKNPDGKDDYPGSLLDFAFVAGPAKNWKAECNIIVREGDFPDDETTSDHRPFELILSK